MWFGSNGPVYKANTTTVKRKAVAIASDFHNEKVCDIGNLPSQWISRPIISKIVNGVLTERWVIARSGLVPIDINE